MARKPTLDFTSPRKSTFGDFAKSYRQSTNVEDRRGKFADKPTATPGSAAGVTTNSRVSQPRDEEEEMYGAPGVSSNTTPPARSDQTRKSSAEEAINKTFRNR